MNWWDTTKLCEAFSCDGAMCLLSDDTPVKNHLPVCRGRVPGFHHSEKTKRRIIESAKGRDMSKVVAASVAARRGKPAHNKGAEYPHLRTTGKLIKDGVVYEVDGIMRFAKEHNISYAHIGSVLNGKRKSHKGFHCA